MPKKLLNKIIIPLRWMDLDAYGHVGNSRYFDFMTDARVAFLKELGVMNDLSKQFLVVDAQCTFLAQTFYPGDLVLEQYCEKVGNSSFTLSYLFYMKDTPETLCAKGALVMVSYDATARKSTPLEDRIRQSLLD